MRAQRREAVSSARMILLTCFALLVRCWTSGCRLLLSIPMYLIDFTLRRALCARRMPPKMSYCTETHKSFFALTHVFIGAL